MEVSVMLIDSFGCEQRDTLLLTSVCPGKVFVPNVFTPNGDNSNDQFCVDIKNISTFSMTVFDRWGIEVYHTDGAERCWDGEGLLGACASGTYYYIFEAEDTMGETLTFRGFVTLLRD